MIDSVLNKKRTLKYSFFQKNDTKKEEGRFIFNISSFQLQLNHPCSSTSFYFNRKNYFLKFRFFFKSIHFWSCNVFISPNTYPSNSIFSVLVSIYKIFSLGNRFYINSVSMGIVLREVNSFIKHMQLINLYYP